MKETLLPPLKLAWHQQSACKVTRQEFMESLGFKFTRAFTDWPADIIDLVDFAASINGEAGTLALSKLIQKNTLAVSSLTGKREAPRNMLSCVLMVGKTFEPIYISRSKNQKVYIVITRMTTRYLDKKTFIKVVSSLISHLYTNTPVVYIP